MLHSLGALIIAFFIGSFPTAYVLGLARGIDIRNHGSGNPGATNAFRVLGKTWGIVCLILDILKGWLPVTVLAGVGGTRSGGALELWLWMLGFAAISGHMFSPFLRFRGGKGVATSLGVILAIAPKAMLAAFVAGVGVIWLTGYVSLASIVGAGLLPILILILQWPERPWVSVLVTILLAGIIVFKHRGNIARLRAGTERRLFEKR